MPRKLHIVQVNQLFLDGGGREEHIFQISKQLVARGHKVTVVSSDYMPTGVSTIGRKAAHIKGLEVVTLKGYLTKVPPGRIAIPDLLEYLMKIKNIDILHGHGMGEKVPEDGLYAAKIKDIPFVFTPHFQPWWAYEQMGAQKIWRVFQKIQMKMVVENSDAVIAVSPQEKKDFSKLLKIHKGYIKVIPNGIAPDLKLPTKSQIHNTFQKYKIPSVKKYLIFLGSVTSPRKGAFEAIQAFRQVREKYPDCHLLLVGPWGTRYFMNQPVVQIMQKLAKAKHVTITGYVSEKEKYALLAGSDLMISPTTYEAFGIALAESLFCKTPVVATNVGGVPFVVRDGKDGLLIKEQKNIPAFARACLRIIKDPGLGKRMGQNGHQRVKQLFHWDAAATKLEQLYLRLANENKRI